MKMHVQRRPVMRLLSGLLLTLSAVAVQAQEFPSRQISVVVATGPGSGQDLLARKIADKLKDRTGQPVVVENKPGGNAFIAMNHVAQSKPDGYTLLLYTSIYIAGPLVQKSFTVDQINDLTHIVRVSLTPGYYVANASAPYKTMQEMFAWAKANPGKLAMAFPAINTQMDATLMFDELGIKINPILYQGTGAAMISNILSGEVQMAQTAYSPIKPHIESGKLRALAVLSPKRFAQTPDVPAMGEIAPQIVMIPNSIGISGPKGMPRALVDRLNTDFNAIVRDASIVEWVTKSFWSEPGGGTPEEWRQVQVQERERYTKAAQKMGLTPQ